MGLLVSFQQLRFQKYRWEQARLVVRFFLSKSEVLVLKHHCLEWSNSSADELLVTVNGFYWYLPSLKCGFQICEVVIFYKVTPFIIGGQNGAVLGAESWWGEIGREHADVEWKAHHLKDGLEFCFQVCTITSITRACTFVFDMQGALWDCCPCHTSQTVCRALSSEELHDYL